MRAIVPSGGKGWKKLSKEVKRKTHITLEGGRRLRCLDWIDEIEKVLPKMLNKETQKPLNHREGMRKIFMEEGVVGVNAYIEMIEDIHAKQTVNLAAAITKNKTNANSGG